MSQHYGSRSKTRRSPKPSRSSGKASSDPAARTAAISTTLAGFLAEPPLTRTVPAKQGQAPIRELLIAIANSYFDGLTTHDGSIILAHPGCTRNENGTHTAGPNPNPDAAKGKGKAWRRLRHSNLTKFQRRLNFTATAIRSSTWSSKSCPAWESFCASPASSNSGIFWPNGSYGGTGASSTSGRRAPFYWPTNDLPVLNWPPYDGNFACFRRSFAAPAAASFIAYMPGRAE